jgi:hypothetical protein
MVNNKLKIMLGVFITYLAIMFGNDYLQEKNKNNNTAVQNNESSAPSNSVSVEPSFCETLAKDTSLPAEKALKQCTESLLKKQNENNPLTSLSTFISSSNITIDKNNHLILYTKQRDMVQSIVQDPNNVISTPATTIYLSVLSLAMQCEDLLENFDDRGLTTIVASLYTDIPTDPNIPSNTTPTKTTEVFRVRVQKSDLPKIKAWLASDKNQQDYELAKDEKFAAMWQVELDKYKDLQYK